MTSMIGRDLQCNEILTSMKIIKILNETNLFLTSGFMLGVKSDICTVEISKIALRFQKYGKYALSLSESDCRYFRT